MRVIPAQILKNLALSVSVIWTCASVPIFVKILNSSGVQTSEIPILLHQTFSSSKRDTLRKLAHDSSELFDRVRACSTSNQKENNSDDCANIRAQIEKVEWTARRTFPFIDRNITQNILTSKYIYFESKYRSISHQS